VERTRTEFHNPARLDAAVRQPLAAAGAHGGVSFAGSLQVVTEALTLPLDSVVASDQVATARRDVGRARHPDDRRPPARDLPPRLMT
jgi:hypothetical protein